MYVSRLIGAIAISSALSFTGCGGESGSVEPDASTADASATPKENLPTDAELLAGIPIPAEKSQTPMDVVSRFLSAVRNGDDGSMGGEALLTHRAIVANRRAGTEFAPPGSPNAQFVVAEEEYLNNKMAAHVLTHWTDEGDQYSAAPSTMDIIWVLKKEPDVGWGIAGALFKPFPDMPEPVVLDFEDPDDFDKTIMWINEEADRRLRVAALPNTPPIDRPQGGAGTNGQGPAAVNGQGPAANNGAGNYPPTGGIQ